MNINAYSYGIIPIYKKDGQIFICAVHNEKSDKWGLPKGTPEDGEQPIETAKRELREETGIENIKIDSDNTYKEIYSFEQNGTSYNKTNTYWIGFVDEMIDKDLNIDSKDMCWIDLKEAENFFEFESLKEIIRELLQNISDPTA